MVKTKFLDIREYFEKSVLEKSDVSLAEFKKKSMTFILSDLMRTEVT